MIFGRPPRLPALLEAAEGRIAPSDEIEVAADDDDGVNLDDCKGLRRIPPNKLLNRSLLEVGRFLFIKSFNLLELLLMLGLMMLRSGSLPRGSSSSSS